MIKFEYDPVMGLVWWSIDKMPRTKRRRDKRGRFVKNNQR